LLGCPSRPFFTEEFQQLVPRQTLSVLELLDQLGHGYTKSLAEGLDLNKIQPPFAALTLADVGLRGSQPFRQLHLAQIGVFPQFSQQPDEDTVVTRKYRFLNGGSPGKG
jgi:hypothetical protein